MKKVFEVYKKEQTPKFDYPTFIHKATAITHESAKDYIKIEKHKDPDAKYIIRIDLKP